MSYSHLEFVVKTSSSVRVPSVITVICSALQVAQHQPHPGGPHTVQADEFVPGIS